jgi:hypothetical protein
MEEILKKKIGKTIPHELIYDIIKDLDYIRRNKKNKAKYIEQVLEELNEASSIAYEAYNSTKSEEKKKKIILFIKYNLARLELVNEYRDTGMYDIKLNFDLQSLCPEDKILNPTTSRCVSKTGAIGKKLLK